jgi:hypothetical protein
MRAVIDVDSVPRGVVVAQGISPLRNEAVRLAGRWRWRPYTG